MTTYIFCLDDTLGIKAKVEAEDEAQARRFLDKRLSQSAYWLDLPTENSWSLISAY